MTETKSEDGRPAGKEVPASAKRDEGEERPVQDDWEKSYRYLLADFDNYRKRVEKEREAAVRMSQGRLLLRIIDLHEGIERVASSLPLEAGSIRSGLQILLKNLDALLKDEKVEPIATVGDAFRTDLHEAVGQVPAPEGAKEGAVAVIVQQGYSGPGGVLRPAKVLVVEPKRNPAEKPEVGDLGSG